MKKLALFIAMIILVVSSVACGNGNQNESKNPSETESIEGTMSEDSAISEESEMPSEVPLEITDAKEILDKVWSKYQDNERFAVVGGHYDNYTDNAPAKYDISKVEDIERLFCIPQETIAMMDDMASLQSGSNISDFSVMACHLKEGANMQVVVDDIKNMVLNNQWVYSHPDRLVIITVGEEYLVSAFGSGELIDVFAAKMLGLYDSIPVLVIDEDI